MADISKITLPSGSTYDLKDSAAREDIKSLKDFAASGVQYVGVTSTPITDGAVTPTTISINDGDNSKDYAVKRGDQVSYNNVMYAWNGSQWDQLGSDSPLKALAYKDSAKADYTPAGSVSQPAFTGAKATISMSGTPSGKVSVTPATGEVQEITGVGSLPAFSATVANETLTLGFDAGTLPTKAGKTVVSGIESASFTGDELDMSADYTPVGSVAKPSFTGDSAVIESK